MMLRKVRIKQRSLQVLAGAVVIIAGGVIGWLLLRPDNAPPTSSTSTPGVTHRSESAPTKLRFIATGDMLPHDTVNQAARTSTGYNYLPLFSNVRPYLRDSDMAYCNQESPSADQYGVSGYPTFNAPVSFARDLQALGCNIINLANNHANDRGQTGISATRQLWSTLPVLAVAGINRTPLEQQHVAVFTKAGIRFAYLAYSKCSNSSLPNSYGLNILSKSLVDRQIAAAKAAGAQMIIVGTHWCHENVSHQDQEEDGWARYFASKDVAIVIGTGPHWLQPVKRIPKAGGGTTLVWFSLGNFLSSQLEVNGLIGGIAVMEIDTASRTVTDVGFLPTYMHYEWSPAQKAAGDLLSRHNLQLYPLDQAASALAHSQNHTTVAEQTTRVSGLLNSYTPVTILTSRTYADFGQ